MRYYSAFENAVRSGIAWIFDKADCPMWIAKGLLFLGVLILLKLLCLLLRKGIRRDLFPPLMASSGMLLGAANIVSIAGSLEGGWAWWLRAGVFYLFDAALAAVCFYLYFKQRGLSIRREYQEHRATYTVITGGTLLLFLPALALSLMGDQLFPQAAPSPYLTPFLAGIELAPLFLLAVIIGLYLFEGKKADSTRLSPRLVYENSRNSLIGRGKQ